MSGSQTDIFQEKNFENFLYFPTPEKLTERRKQQPKSWKEDPVIRIKSLVFEQVRKFSTFLSFFVRKTAFSSPLFEKYWETTICFFYVERRLFSEIQ